MNNPNFYSIPRVAGKLDSGAYNTQEGTILEAKKCCGLFHVSDQAWRNFNLPPSDAPGTDQWEARAAAQVSIQRNLPLICIKFRQKKCWAPIRDITGTSLLRYRTHIEVKIKEFLDVQTTEQLPEKDPAIEAILGILTSEQLGTLLENDAFRKTSFGSKICKCCGKFTTGDMKKCLHYDCTGCCATCAKIPLLIPQGELPGYGQDGGNADDVSLMVNVCRACKREQKTECPICQDKKEAKELCILGCRHVFCWKCYSMWGFLEDIK